MLNIALVATHTPQPPGETFATFNFSLCRDLAISTSLLQLDC